MSYNDGIEICAAADKGPWELDPDDKTFVQVLDDPDAPQGYSPYTSIECYDADYSAFIAHFDPVRVRELVEENRRLQHEALGRDTVPLQHCYHNRIVYRNGSWYCAESRCAAEIKDLDGYYTNDVLRWRI